MIMTLAAMTACGCMGPRRDDYISSRTIAMATESAESDKLWEAVQETLRRGRFRLDRVDRPAGVVTTMPVMSQHFFEFWRHDVDTRPDLWEATINPIRRRVEISLDRDEAGDWRKLVVAVHKERFYAPDRQFNSTGSAYEFFDEQLPSMTGRVRSTTESEQWIDLGRDPAMEDYLLRSIFDRAASEAASPSLQ